MAVYAVPNNRPIRSNKPLKWKRVLTEEQKKMYEFMDTHDIRIYTDDETGEVVIKAVERNED